MEGLYIHRQLTIGLLIKYFVGPFQQFALPLINLTGVNIKFLG